MSKETRTMGQKRQHLIATYKSKGCLRSPYLR